VIALAPGVLRAAPCAMPIAHLDGLDIAYEEHGDGEPLVLVSGIGMQLVAWPRGLIELFAARGFRVVTLDNRDVGLSSKLDARGVPNVGRMMVRALLGLPLRAPYTLFDMAGDVARLLDALGLDRAHVAGVSLGGMIAQAMAIAHGGRMKSLVSMMSYPGGRVLTAGDPRVTWRLLARPARSRAESVAQIVAFFRAAGSPGFARDDGALAERMGLAFDRNHHPQGFARQLAAALATGDLGPRLRGVRVPTLVLHGTADPIILASRGRETARAIPGAKLRLIEGWGHDLAEGVWPLLADAIAAHAKEAAAR
jgi:pimeloyl-ACP methyl ester carboxylesterase